MSNPEQTQPRPSRAREYWCHQCQQEIVPMMAPHPVCPRCHGDFVEEIDTSNDPREFVADTGEDDEMEREFGGAGNYNQELQGMLQEILTHIMGPAGAAGTADSQEAEPPTAETPGGNAQGFSGMRTFTSNLNNGAQVSVSFGSLGGSPRGSTESQERPARPMFIDPEENAPLSLGNLLSSLMGALGGPRGQASFGFPVGNLGDYVWNQRSLDDVITQLMEQNQSAHAPPPASEDAIKELRRRAVTGEEAGRKEDCSICQDEYKQGEEVVELPCKHLFHDECIKHWLNVNGTCPICRAGIEAGGVPEGMPVPHSDLPGAFPASGGGNSSSTTGGQAAPVVEPMDLGGREDPALMPVPPSGNQGAFPPSRAGNSSSTADGQAAPEAEPMD